MLRHALTLACGLLVACPAFLNAEFRRSARELARAKPPGVAATRASFLNSEVQRSKPEFQTKTDELARAFSARLEQIASSVDGSVAYLVVDLTTGQRFERRAAEPFPTASAIKIGILHELFVQADAGTVSLDDPRPLPAASRAGGAGILHRLSSPVLSLRDHALLMILLSDNTATNVLIDTLGADRITAHMQALGASGYQLRRRMMDGAAAARGDENLASANDLAIVMDAIRTGRGLRPESQAEAIRILREYGPTSVRAGLPAGIPVATKPGSLDGVRTEVSWVALEGRPYLLVVLVSFLADYSSGDAAIRNLSAASHRYFWRLARAGVEGRLLDR